MSWPDPLLLATGNADKVREWRTIGAHLALPVLAVRPDLPSPHEGGATCEDNARIKALNAARYAEVPALGDDVGMAVDALGGAPGKDLKPWAEALGGWSGARDVLARVGGPARYHCALALAWPDGRIVSVEAVIHGRVGVPAGTGPGVEPCFTPDGEARSLSELPPEVRRLRHHRWRAVAMLAERLRETLPEGPSAAR